MATFIALASKNFEIRVYAVQIPLILALKYLRTAGCFLVKVSITYYAVYYYVGNVGYIYPWLKVMV